MLGQSCPDSLWPHGLKPLRGTWWGSQKVGHDWVIFSLYLLVFRSPTYWLTTLNFTWQCINGLSSNTLSGTQTYLDLLRKWMGPWGAYWYTKVVSPKHRLVPVSLHPEFVMATHSSTLAWRIPGEEEPGRLKSMRSPRVRQDWTTSLSLFTFTHWRRKWRPTPVFLPGESQGRKSLVGCRLWGRTESDTTEAT